MMLTDMGVLWEGCLREREARGRLGAEGGGVWLVSYE